MPTPIKAATLLKEASSNNRGVILVRPIKANSVDREAIHVMGKKIFDESRYAHDRKYNREAVDELLNEWGRGSNIFCSIAELNGKCIGAMAGFIQECWFAHGNVAYDFFLYVEPEHRGSSAALRLIRAYEKWARMQNVLEVTLGISTGINTEQTGKFYQRLGYNKVGSTFCKEN